MDKNMPASYSVSYDRLWRMLVDRKIKQNVLAAEAGISQQTLARMKKNGHITTVVLAKLCGALGCKVEDILEFIPDDEMT